MVKIINGKKYNTETAELIANYCNELSYSDFRRVDESLYKKKTGEFFLYGKGGALTRYAERNGDGSCSAGEKIIPLTIEDAMEWCEYYVCVEIYEELFGEVEE